MCAQSIRQRKSKSTRHANRKRTEVWAIDAIDWLHDFVMLKLSECEWVCVCVRVCVLAHAAIYSNRMQTHSKLGFASIDFWFAPNERRIENGKYRIEHRFFPLYTLQVYWNFLQSYTRTHTRQSNRILILSDWNANKLVHGILFLLVKLDWRSSNANTLWDIQFGASGV